jgi:hypothetical protein
MANQILSAIKNFENFSSEDPEILINEKIIELKPNYLNLSLVANLIFLGLVTALIIKSFQVDIKSTILSFGAAILFFYMIIRQITYLNWITINLDDRKIKIKSSILLSLFIKQEEIKFDEIKDFIYSYDTFNPAFRRYEIKAVLESKQKKRLISCRAIEIAKNLINSFSFLLIQ